VEVAEQIVVTEAVEKEANAVKREKFEVVIVGTYSVMSPYEIADKAEAVSAHRIFRRVNGIHEPTTAVVLTYEQEPPQSVYVEHERFKTRPYIKQAIRCHHCQRFNHRQAGCRNKAKCARCAEDHRKNECELDTDQPLRCANCHWDHSSASPTCSKFQEVKQAWKIVASDKKSYAEAIHSVVKSVNGARDVT